MLAWTESVQAPEPLFTYATSVASAQAPSSLQTPDVHSECAAHFRQVNAVVLQTGVGFLQSVDARHSTHRPAGPLQRGVAGLWARHCTSSDESMHARHLCTEQIGATSLHCADDVQNMSGPAGMSLSRGTPPSASMQVLCVTSHVEYGGSSQSRSDVQ